MGGIIMFSLSILSLQLCIHGVMGEGSVPFLDRQEFLGLSAKWGSLASCSKEFRASQRQAKAYKDKDIY